jgi:hypothetical protein
VRIDNNGSQPEKLSFVGNSGVKFGGKEVAILDVESMVGKGGEAEEVPLDAFDPSQGGYIQSNGNVDTGGAYTTEPLNKLMTGVIYGGDYKKMADWGDSQNDPDSAADYFSILENNYDRTNSHIKIDVTLVSGSTYTVNVYLDNEQQTCYSETLTLTSLATLNLQSHWGSGVIFTNMDVTAKA